MQAYSDVLTGTTFKAGHLSCFQMLLGALKKDFYVYSKESVLKLFIFLIISVLDTEKTQCARQLLLIKRFNPTYKTHKRSVSRQMCRGEMQRKCYAFITIYGLNTLLLMKLVKHYKIKAFKIVWDLGIGLPMCLS